MVLAGFPYLKGGGMKQRLRITFAVLTVIILALAVTAIIAPRALANATTSNLADEQELLVGLSETAILLEAAPPPPEKDPCQHCHLSGSIDDMWTPVWRWVLFGFMGLVFAFGTYRAGSVLTSRKPWKPIWTRVVEWVDERYNVVEPLGKILAKPVPRFATHWMYCLGGITFLLFAIQGVTGTLLAFYYKPTPQEAFASIQFIENEVRFGAAIRAIHHWSANGMVVMVIAHMVRVFLTGAFKSPREFNWISGVLLFVITLAFGLTGYLLPWDQRAFWATTVSSGIAGGIPQIGDLALVFLRGGWEVTAITLSRFYALHVLVLPLSIVVLLFMHFWMVRRLGIARPL
jgi:cytochrome b6